MKHDLKIQSLFLAGLLLITSTYLYLFPPPQILSSQEAVIPRALLTFSAIAFFVAAGLFFKPIRRAGESLLALISSSLGGKKCIHLLAFYASMAALILALILLILSLTDLAGVNLVYFQLLFPLSVWMFAQSLLALWALSKSGSEIAALKPNYFLILIAIILLAVFVHTSVIPFSSAPKGKDIYFSFEEGNRIIDGVNPYSRVLSGNLQDNDNYPTLFPLFYYLSAILQLLGANEYSLWIAIWRVVFIACNILLAVFLYQTFLKKRMLPFSISAAIFWLFNRWNLRASQSIDQDFLAILLFVMAVALFKKNRFVSYLLFGISLAVKQIAIFAAPLFVLWAIQPRSSAKWQEALKAIALVSLIPFIASIQFIAWDFEGFIKSVFFSVTRTPAGLPSLGVRLGLEGFPAILPLILLLSFLYLSYKKLPSLPFTHTAMVMFAFVAFNPIIFDNYILWFIPFLLLAVKENRVGLEKTKF